MSHSWSPSDGVTRRLFNTAIAALLAFTMLVAIPGNVGPALADPPGSDYILIFSNASENGPGEQVSGFTTSNDVTVTLPDGTQVGPIHLSCSENFHLYDDKFDHTVDRSHDDWGYAEGSGAPDKNSSDPRLWDFRISRDSGKFAGTFCGFGEPEPASLSLVKNVVNDSGGTAVASDWTLSAGSNDVTGSETGEVATTTAGTYALSESAVAGYTQTSLTCDDDPQTQVTSVELRSGQTITCTFVNNDNPPRPGPAIDIEKSTNGSDADSPTGPSILVGGLVTWTYVVTNIGNVTLTNIVVTDSDLGPICNIASLGPSDSESCTKTGTATLGQYANIGKATGDYDQGETTVEDTDPSHYIGVTTPPLPEPGIDIEKSTNGADADATPGPSITIGDPVTWTYVVTNIGQVHLSGVIVTDDILGAICTIGDLAIGASSTCTFTGTAVAGQYANVGTATDNNGNGSTVVDTDPSHYFGQEVAASGTIGDTVWSDENDNGIQDNGEKGIAGATVRLTLPDGTTIQMNTNANGLYLFSALEAGAYNSELILSSIPDPAEGSLKLTTAGSFTIQLADGQSFLDADFGVVAALPATGISADSLALIAMALLGAGGLAVLSTRRRQDDLGEGDIAN